MENDTEEPRVCDENKQRARTLSQAEYDLIVSLVRGENSFLNMYQRSNITVRRFVHTVVGTVEYHQTVCSTSLS